MKNERLVNFDSRLAQRLFEIGEGYNPECVECLDLDYTLEWKSGEPTLCIPCAVKNMHKLQATLKGMTQNEKV